MLQLTNKRFLIYIFLLILLGTINNRNLKEINLFQISEINISGLEASEKKELSKKLNFFYFKNLFFLDRSRIEEVFNDNNSVETYQVFKKYPSTLKVKTKKTKFIAYVKKDDKIFYLGSNSKLIEAQNKNYKIPFIFGTFEIKNFLDLKKIIKESKFNFSEIKNFFFFPSGRIDIETNKGIFIKLPINEFRESLDLSFLILQNPKFEKIKIIDLRQKNQVIINGKQF